MDEGRSKFNAERPRAWIDRLCRPILSIGKDLLWNGIKAYAEHLLTDFVLNVEKSYHILGY